MKTNRKPLFVGHLNILDTPVSQATDPILSVTINEDMKCLQKRQDIYNVLLCSNFPYNTRGNVLVISDYKLVSLMGNFYQPHSESGKLVWDIDGIVSQLKKMISLPAILRFFAINNSYAVNKNSQWLSFD